MYCGGDIWGFEYGLNTFTNLRGLRRPGTNRLISGLRFFMVRLAWPMPLDAPVLPDCQEPTQDSGCWCDICISITVITVVAFHMAQNYDVQQHSARQRGL